MVSVRMVGVMAVAVVGRSPRLRFDGTVGCRGGRCGRSRRRRRRTDRQPMTGRIGSLMEKEGAVRLVVGPKPGSSRRRGRRHAGNTSVTSAKIMRRIGLICMKVITSLDRFSKTRKNSPAN